MTGTAVAAWIRSHPNTHLVCTTSRNRRQYWLVHNRTGEWFPWIAPNDR